MHSCYSQVSYIEYAPHLGEFFHLDSMADAESQVNHCHYRHRDLSPMRIEYGDERKSCEVKKDSGDWTEFLKHSPETLILFVRI